MYPTFNIAPNVGDAPTYVGFCNELFKFLLLFYMQRLFNFLNPVWWLLFPYKTNKGQNGQGRFEHTGSINFVPNIPDSKDE